MTLRDRLQLMLRDRRPGRPRSEVEKREEALATRAVPPLPPELPTYPEAIRAMADPLFLASSRYREQQSRADRANANETVQLFAGRLVRELKALNAPFFPHQFWRSDTEQLNAFLDGKSQAKPGQSPHNYGFAVDIIHSVRGWNLPRMCWDVVGHVGKEICQRERLDFVWGGDFKSIYDPAHWELADWRARVHAQQLDML